MKSLPAAIQLVMVLALFMSIQVFGHSIEIVGPDHVTVKVGQPVKLTYLTYIDGRNMTGLHLFNSNPVYDPYVSNVSKNIEVYRDAEGDIYSDAPTSEPYYVAGVKPGIGYFDLSANTSFFDGNNAFTTKRITITVKKGSALCLNGELIDYSTRSNKFTVMVRNYSSKPVKILSNGAKAINYDYKVFDRSLRISGKNSVVIKPGKTKRISFKASGKSTWYDVESFYIRCKCKYGKKTAEIRIYSSDSETSVNGTIPGYIAAKRKGRWTSMMLCAPDFENDSVY